MKHKKRLIFWRWFSVICFSCFPIALFSQVNNGSFETGDQPSLNNWRIICFGESYQDAPNDGGDWCLKLEAGNTQGCFPGIAYQIIPDIKNGEIWQASVWSKYNFSFTNASIYFSIIHTDSTTVLSTDTTTSNTWTQLTVIDTILLEPGDSVTITLDAGMTGGPVGGHSYFDLVTAEKIGELNINPNEDGYMQPNQFYLFQNYPNPFNPITTIRYELPQRSDVQITIYDLLGRKVTSLVNQTQEAGLKSVTWNATNYRGKPVSAGVYLYQIQAGDFVQTKKMVLLK